MRDKIGDHEDRMDVIFHTLGKLKEDLSILNQRLNWLENPESAPKSKQPKPKPIEVENL